MKYAVEMGSGAMIYIPSFINTGSGIQKLMGDTQTHRQDEDRISLLLVFQNKESRPMIIVSRVFERPLLTVEHINSIYIKVSCYVLILIGAYFLESHKNILRADRLTERHIVWEVFSLNVCD
jgi:hypothetical protein